MRILFDYIKTRLPIILMGLCLITGALASMVYGKYVNNNKSEADINVTGQAVLSIPVTGGKDTVTGEYIYSVTNSPIALGGDGTSVPAYIRAAIVVNWQNSDGELWAVPPVENKDYIIKNIDSTSNCQKLDGYYYYKGECAPNSSFPIIVTLTAGAKPPTGYSLHVKILAEGIQCVPANAVEEAWGVRYQSGTWVLVTP